MWALTMADSHAGCIPHTDSLQVSAQVSGLLRIFPRTGIDMRKTLPHPLLSIFVVPAAHAAEPTSTPRNAAPRCGAWRSGTRTGQLVELTPGSTRFFQAYTRGLDTRNLFDRCVSSTASRLASAGGAGSAATSVAARCRADLAHGGSTSTNAGRCVSNGGRPIRP